VTVTGVVRGRLAPDAAPAIGEQLDVLWESASARVEHIVSGRLEGPVEFDQDDDEWVLVLAVHQLGSGSRWAEKCRSQVGCSTMRYPRRSSARSATAAMTSPT
jgi:hypothetical protein